MNIQKINGCDIINYVSNTYSLFEEQKKSNTYDIIYNYLGKPVKNNQHIISTGFVEGSGAYKNVMDLYDEYVTKGYEPPIILLTKKIRDSKEKIRNFFAERSAAPYLLDDTTWDEHTSIGEKYKTVESVYHTIMQNHSIGGCISQGRQTLFPFACQQYNIPYIMMHGSGPDHTISNTVDDNNYPQTVFHFNSYQGAKAYLITALLSPTEQIDEHFKKCGFINQIPFIPIFQPYKTSFQEKLQETLSISPQYCRDLIIDKKIFTNYNTNIPLVYVSRSGTLFDMEELGNPDSLFMPEQLQQSEDRLVDVIEEVHHIAMQHNTKIAIYADKEAINLITGKYPNQWPMIDFLMVNGSYMKDEDYLLLRRGGVEISRAAQSGATTIGYGVGGAPIILTVPHEDINNNLPDYMFETASAKVYGEHGCPVIDTNGNIREQLQIMMQPMLQYKNSQLK